MARLTLIVRNMWSVSGGFVVSSFRKWSFVRTRTTVALRSLNSISSISGRPFMLHHGEFQSLTVDIRNRR
jgi:hypothetical protein